ncbi:hypothetical protein DXA05_05220 [Bacteroides sp. AM54-2NS]|nr:hypothetical protein DXA05_05220 [Bacteroides sp. AM54-2NS]
MFLPGAELPLPRCRTISSSVPEEAFIGAGHFQAAKIEKSNKKEGRIYIIYEILPFYLFTCRTSVR